MNDGAGAVLQPHVAVIAQTQRGGVECAAGARKKLRVRALQASSSHAAACAGWPPLSVNKAFWHSAPAIQKA